MSWPKDSRQEKMAAYMAQQDEFTPWRKTADQALSSIRGSDGYGGMGWCERAEFIYAMEWMVALKIAQK